MVYSEIDTLFKDHKFEAAEYELGKLADPELDSTLSTGERYAILRLKAKLALEQLQYDEAARLFTLAYDTCPDLSQSRQNHVLALALSGDRKQAFIQAERLLDDGVDTAFLVGLLISNSEVPTDLSRHQPTITKYTSSEDVNVAIVHRYLAWDQLAPAAVAAQRAMELAPASAYAIFARGMVAHYSVVRGDWQNRNTSITEAIHYYSEAITAAERGKHKALLPEIHCHRARVYALARNVIGRFKTSHREALQNQPVGFVLGNVTVPWGVNKYLLLRRRGFRGVLA